MRITPLPGQTLRLPLDTAFVLDLDALLPPETVVYGFYLDLDTEDAAVLEGLDYQMSDNERSLTIIPRTTWTGIPAPEGDTSAIAGQMVFFTNGSEPFVLDLTATLDPRDGTVHAGGTAGRDTILFDAQDPNLGTTYLVDTRGGSDLAQIVNGAAVMLGRGGDDTLIGWDGNDALYGGGNNDALYGRGGIDRLMGQASDDALFGGAGADVLSGGAGNDSVVGGAGDDTLEAGEGNDTVRGEDGNDRILLTRNLAAPVGETPAEVAGTLVAFGGNGNDLFQPMNNWVGSAPIADPEATIPHGGMVFLHGGEGNDSIYAGAVQGGALFGGIGNDALSGSILEEHEGNLRFYGGAGDDFISGGHSAQAWGGSGADMIGLGDGGTAWGGDGDDMINIASYMQGALIYAGAGNDSLETGEGNDTIHGGAGDDVLYGGMGRDSLYGGLGNDTLYGGNGADLLSGGQGADTLAASDANVYTPGDYSGDLVMKTDTLFGGAGNDALTADRNGHHLYGGSGSDTLTVTLINSLSGGTTILDGGLGNDIIRSEGQTRATGGEGADTFQAKLGNPFFHTMIVEDFERGTDRLSVSYSFEDSMGNTSEFVFRSAGTGIEGFMQGARTIVWQQEEGGVRVMFDFNGDQMSDGAMFVVGATDVLASDFDAFSII